ncbi:hypothetical protein ACUN29_41365 (plasmid) [Streptomyces sp. WC2508]|uniref:hypothetical protein n=1 Tax=Streptomyces sp. WC2508 TaxID=3461405 RepID=UPI0040447209
MHDPASPSPEKPSPPPAGPRGPDQAAAADAVRQVFAWYGQQILAVQRAADPDPARLEQLMARQRACVQDLSTLEEGGPGEAERIAALYEARLRELKGPGPHQL